MFITAIEINIKEVFNIILFLSFISLEKNNKKSKLKYRGKGGGEIFNKFKTKIFENRLRQKI